MEIQREILPESYLLILTDEENSLLDQEALALALRSAVRSGKPSIWVDCSQLHRLPAPTISLLVGYYRRLQQRNVQLVLCHLDDSLQHAFSQTSAATQVPVVPTLLDADLYCHAHLAGAPRASA
ncbi:STAS domain-containing protein [Hymenobacter sp. BT491]|uniref:STAS domain-containing protein n=1 Tax=Hymenobacter sp. BT491 TaxID=2766779 RepID=UPI00165386B2|nr:STAS domain-containing protein [Hymenobacter sp. BT491]MBC6991091.1 STAS domain-containing protein [Hymenobacter sp. BT491]